MKEINENYFKNIGGTKSKTVEELLDANEKILWKGKPKKRSYAFNKTIKLMPVAILWAIIDFGVIATTFFVGGMESFEYLFFIPFFALHLFPFWLWLFGTIKASKEINNIIYVITNKRIVEIKGKYRYISNSIHIDNLKDAELKREGLDKLLRVGDIYLTGENGCFVMFDIPHSEEICEKIKNLIINKEECEEFYDGGYECSHCGTIYDKSEKKCVNCGAPKQV